MNRVVRIKVAERSPNGYARMDEKTFEETHWEMKADIMYMPSGMSITCAKFAHCDSYKIKEVCLIRDITYKSNAQDIHMPTASIVE